jgi:hypothetical protein
LMIAILTGVRWNIRIILICISFMTKGVEHILMYLLAICTCFVNCLCNSVAHFTWIICSLNSGPVLVRQVLYHWIHPTSKLFCSFGV